jgi:hypothetical protein
MGQAAEQLDSVAGAVGSLSQQFRDQEMAWLATATDRTAEQIEHFAGYLRETDAEQLFREAERFARRQPALFIGGAFVLGLLAGRFMKAAAPPESRLPARRYNYGYSPSSYRAYGQTGIRHQYGSSAVASRPGPGGYGTTPMSGYQRPMATTPSSTGTSTSPSASRGSDWPAATPSSRTATGSPPGSYGTPATTPLGGTAGASTASGFGASGASSGTPASTPAGQSTSSSTWPGTGSQPPRAPEKENR